MPFDVTQLCLLPPYAPHVLFLIDHTSFDMDEAHILSLELIQGVSRFNNEHLAIEDVDSTLCEYLLKGRGCKILKYFHQQIGKGITCPQELAHLSASLINFLTLFKPTDFHAAYESGHNEDRFFHSLNGNWACLHQHKTDWVKLYNNLLKSKKKKFRKGKKLKPPKRRSRFYKLTRRRRSIFTPSSSDHQHLPSIPYKLESKLLKKLSQSKSIKSKDRTGKEPFLKSTRLKRSKSVMAKNATDRLDIKSCSKENDSSNLINLQRERLKGESHEAFEGPFELAKVLLDLLESSFCSRYTHSTSSAPPTSPTDGDSPMSMAIQLVTAITALQQTKEASFTRSNSIDNNDLMSQISFEDTHWTVDSLSHLQKLVLRTVIVLCHVGLNHGEDIKELVHAQAVESLINMSSALLKKGGMIPHGSSVQKRKRSSLSRRSVGNGNTTASDQSTGDCSDSTAEEAPLPSFVVTQEETFQEKFENKYSRLGKYVSSDITSAIPAHLVLVSDVITGIFSVLTHALQQSSGVVSSKQLTEVCSLMHEFKNCNGFHVFYSLLQQVCLLCDDVIPTHDSFFRNMPSPMMSPLKSPFNMKARPFLTPSKDHPAKISKTDNIPYHVFTKLLLSFEEVITTIQKSKVEHMHNSTCSRRNHRSCELNKLIPLHHSLLGCEARHASIIKPLCEFDFNSSSSHHSVKAASNNTAPKRRSLIHATERENRTVCVVAVGTKFLVDLSVTLKCRSNFLRDVLRTLDRIGVCQCGAMSSLMVPLLCNFPTWSEKTQNVALALSGKIMLHHYNEDDTKSKDEQVSSTSMFLYNTPTTWFKHLTSNSSEQNGLFGDKTSNNSWRHSLPMNMKIRDSNSSSKLMPSTAEELMFVQNVNFPWLCLCLYQTLLHSTNGDLALKVALHLQSISQHLCNAAKSALTTLVFIPVFCNYAGVSWEAVAETANDKQKRFSEDVVFIVLGIILQFIEESSNCRVLFIRHGGMKAINEIMSKSFAERGVTSSPNGSVVCLVLDMLRVISTLSSVFLHNANVAVFKPNCDKCFKQSNLTVAGTTDEPGAVRSFFRGISFSWGADRRRFKDSRERSTSFDSNASKNILNGTQTKTCIGDTALSMVCVDESSVYFLQLKKFVQMSLNITGASSYDQLKEKVLKSLSRTISGADSTDSESDLKATGRKKRKHSETSGYRSNSPELPERSISNDQTSLSSKSLVSNLSYATESVRLPSDTDVEQWKNLSCLWNILGLGVPHDGQLCTLFIEMNGFNIALKLLSLIASGINSHFDSLNFTQTTADVTADDNFYETKSLDTSMELLSDGKNILLSNAENVAHAVSVPKIEISDSIETSNLKKTASLDNLLSDKFNMNFFKTSSVTDNAAGESSNDPSIDIEFQHDVLQRKLNLFTSCLRICFFCAKLPDQFDIDAVDIISMLKPALSGRISSIEFAGMLHTSFFEAAIEPINDPEEGFMSLKTVLNGLQRTINSGGTATKAHSRNNSVFARSPTPVNQPNERGDFLNLGSPANYTDGLGSQHVTRDDDEDTFSDALSSDGYEGDSESASHNSTAVSADYCLLSHTPGRTYDMLDFYEHDLKFDKGTLIHPELILLSIELLSHVSDRDGADFGFSCDTDGENERTVIATDPQRAATARDDIGLAVIRALFQIAIFSNANLRKMSKRNDVASACLTHFADFLHTDNENWKDHRQVLLSLCMTLNKHHMTSKHLRLILSLLNCNNPPLQQILNYLLELVDHQSFGPNWFLNFTWMRQIQLEGSDATDSDTDDEITGQKEADRTPHRSLTVWEVAPLRMPLESRIPWPPVGGGITISLWLKVSLNDNEHTSTVNCSNWAEGHVIVVEADQGVSAQSSPYIHLLSIGSKQTMLQVWLENTTLIFRVCVDPNDGKPVGLLAQTECSNFLNMNEWQHLTITFTESRMPDKTILGKVHLIVNCFIEHDVVLEFNVPPIPKTTLSSWRQSSAISLNMQATTFFLGHCDHCTVTNSSSASTSSTVSVGNVMLFNQPHPSCQSAFMLEQLGPNATGLTECLSDASSKTIQDDFMKNYRVRFGSDPLLSVAPERPSSGPSLRLFRLIPQALSNDTIPHEILMGEAQPNIKSLQESLIMSFNAAEPSIFYVYGVNPTATPTRRRMLFRRAPADPVSSSVNFDPLTQRGHKMKVQRPYKDKTYPVLCAGLNRSLNQVGGVMVFLLLYPKVVEHLSTQNISSDRAEKLQIIALTSLLKLRASSTERRNEFSTAGVASMLHKVMTKEECVVGFPTLQLLFNTACSEEVILNVDDGNGGIVYQVNPETSAVVHDFEILKMFLLDWKIWYKAKNIDGKADFSVWLLLLQSLESLTGDDHPYQWFNSKILLRAAIIHRLLEGIQEMVNDGVHPLPGRDVTMMMVEVIRGVMGSPPDIAIINTLSNFVIAVHPPTGTFVSHSTSNFFFSLSNSHFLKSKSKHSRSLELNKLEDETESTSESQTPARHKSLSALQQSSVSRTMNGHPPVPLKSLMSTPSVINNDSSDTSTTDENVPATPVPDIIFEDDPTPSNKPSETTYQRSLSDRHTLTPIKEDVQKSPRPKSLDVPSVSTHVVDTNDEVHVEVTSEGHISMGLHSQVSETPSSTFTGLDSWENLPHHLEAEDGDYELSEDDGLCGLVTEILNILFISVMTMRDVDIPIVLGDSLNSEMLVVLSNHSSPDIRTAVIRLLAAYFSRCSSEEQAQFLKKKGFHLVANQLHQHVTTYPIAEACFYFLLGQPVGIEETLPVDGTGPGSMSFSHDLFSNHAVIVLLAILKKSFSNGPELCYHLLSRLNELFEFVGPIADLMLDNGLTLALSNLLNAINLHSKQYLRPSEKQLLYDAVEDFMGSIAIKSCLTSGSGHFEVLEDLVILIHTVEKKAAKVFGENSCEVNAVKSLIHNLFLRILDSIKLSSCGKTIPSKRKHSVDLPSLSPKSMARSSGSSGAELPKVIPGASLFTGLISTPDSPLSDTSSSMKSNVFLPAATIGHQRSRSMGAGNDMFYVPSPYLSRGSNLTPHSIPGPLTENRGSSFRPRTSALRSRSFKGSQRRRINETETANRLQRVVAITVDFIIFMDQQNGTEQNSNKWKNFAPVSSPTHLFLPTDDISDVNEATSPQSLQDERSFAQLTFDMLLEWLFSLLDATETHRRRSSTSQSTYSWERILNIAQNVIAEQITRLMVHFLSPWQVDLKIRTYPLKIVNHQKCETLLTNLLPQSSIDGQKVAVYLQYLLLCYKQQLSKQEKHDGKKLLKIISRIGHRVSSQHRRAIQDTNSEQEASIPDPLTEYQDKFDRERRQHRLEWNKSNICQFQLLVNRTSRLAEHVSRHAMDMTQQVVLQQNSERKKMISRMKDVISNDLNIRKKWTMLLEQLAHERAIWYNPEQYPKSWQLDPTEGPFRERRRLQRCHIGIDKRFLLSTASDNMKKRGRPVSMNDGNNQSHLTSFAVTHKRPLAFLFEDDSHSSDSITIRTRLQTNERISMVQSCTNVTAACETSGEILIGENNMYFVGDKAIVDPSLTQAIFGEREILSLSWLHRDVAEYHKRWWQLRDTAIEIFLINGKTYLLAFKNIKERDLIYDELSKLDLPNLTQSDDLQAITKAWFAGRMTNFEYLTKLNKTAGRSFNDLMQYPVMPFILSDYSSQILDLEATSSYRILEKPISVQDPSREQHFRERYKFLEDDYKNCSEDERELKTPPFHYGSHYSNSGTVLHFLVRLPPFTQLFLEYQDASFDIPDRTFHSMATTYRLSSYASTTDVKELIPEFFFLPEFLCNLEGFDFGLRQCGIRVHHVTLPLWCREDPRLFVLIHRQALESDYVTSHLHQWVDLVFGFKQMGQAALDAVNVFHPATYFGMDISSVDEPVKRRALETMVKTYGQTPKMLFNNPHPARSIEGENTRNGDAVTSQSSKNSASGLGEMLPTSILGSLRGNADGKTYRRFRNSKVPRPIPSVKGLQWGEYLGSPSAPDPTIFLHKLVSSPIGRLVPLQTNDVCALAPNMSLLVVYTREKKSNSDKPIDISWSALITFDKSDDSIRLKLKHNIPGINLARFSSDNHITCCVATPDCRSIIFGSSSGTIIAQRCNPSPEKGCDVELLPSTALYCHTSEVTCLSVCGTFRVFVSGSVDGTAAIWDLDSLSYVRSLTGHAGVVRSLAVSETSGDICTVCDSGNDNGSHIRLWTINGSLVAAQDCRYNVRCVAFSNAAEGVSVNVVAGGLENGTIRMWSSWDLTHVRDITTQSVHQPIVSIAFTHNSMVLYAATDGGLLVGWCRKDKEKEKQPLLITFLDAKTSPMT